ncbi:MAG TPA: ABC transporter ATP-binding protein [Thermoanaerobaculia bacterium]|nr:ABC transporter ATP-binding protein [Thermoanaerobaculia bacterium]
MSGVEHLSVASVERLTVRYGRYGRNPALSGVTFTVPRGSVYALLGRNGAGKSSLMRCLLGQQKPASGSARLFNEDSWKNRARLMARIGIVPEEPDAPPEMTAREVFGFCRKLYASWDGKGVEDRLSRFAVPTGVAFGRLSKGQKAQVMLSAALGHRPELLVLDDPTLGLDPVARKAFFEELIGDLADRGTTVFLATHDLGGIEGIATRVGILKAGKLVLDDEMENVKARFRRIHYGNDISVEREAWGTELDDFDAARVRARGWGVEAVVSNFDEVTFERFRQKAGVTDAEASAMSLEEIFLAVAGEAPPPDAAGRRAAVKGATS